VKGRVTRIDPAGFTKISALGIEEQRVRTTIDFADPPANWSKLGHDYRVTVHITAWSSDEVLTVPVSALFRAGNEWAVFSVRDGKARLTSVTVGHRNNRVAEITAGLVAGDRIVVHPSDRVTHGTRVSER
jgi:HlyD family secretion protein